MWKRPGSSISNCGTMVRSRISLCSWRPGTHREQVLHIVLFKADLDHLESESVYPVSGRPAHCSVLSALKTPSEDRVAFSHRRIVIHGNSPLPPFINACFIRLDFLPRGLFTPEGMLILFIHLSSYPSSHLFIGVVLSLFQFFCRKLSTTTKRTRDEPVVFFALYFFALCCLLLC